MGFFDLNIPHLDSSLSDKTAFKARRTKLVIKAMELGYTGIAYNRTIKGVMSDNDRCAISLLTLSSLLKLSPSLSSSVGLHRDFLGVPRASPFRQYTRLTVCVESQSQAQALNSGNPILKTYDLVAVRALNQTVFDQACEKLEVDIIAIDFSEKLPFRLKLPMVKAAIARGVYFEITYSDLISDVQTRRQMISNAKLLVDWTQGKNLILSSAALSVNDIRGPNDVANLSSLLGLSRERAKAAISKNCRTLVAKSLRKKQFFKEAIRVEVISAGGQLDSTKSLSGDWLKWDPISSGEGDLLLEDMAKSFSASSEASKTVKAIDFTSVIESMPSLGFQVKALISQTEAVPQPPDVGKTLLAATEVVEVSAAAGDQPEQLERLDIVLRPDQTSFDDSLSHQSSGFVNTGNLNSASDTKRAFTNSEEIRTPTTTSKVEEETKSGSDVKLFCNVTEKYDLELQKCVCSRESHIVPENEDVTFGASTRDLELAASCDAVSKRDLPMLSEDVGLPVPMNEDSKSTNKFDVVLGFATDGVSMEVDTQNQDDRSLAFSGAAPHEPFAEREQFQEPGMDVALLSDRLPTQESYFDQMIISDSSAANHESVVGAMDKQRRSEADTESHNPTLAQCISGRSRPRPRGTVFHRAVLFPLKHLLNPIAFKKRSKKRKSGVKML